MGKKIHILLVIIIGLFIVLTINFCTTSIILDNSEISNNEYMALYIECQQNTRFTDRVRKCFDDKKITNSEYKDLIKNVRLSNKQVLSHILSTK